ncbi:hypothetical protein A0257_02155 [Hymenobacter psoromatis]|nr:hypothetical protein A0257_02155 [Hymenobacter psoromatis]
MLAAGWWSRPAAAQAPTPPLVPEAATLVGTYRLTYQPDSTDAKTRTEILYLWLGKTLSLFESQGKFASDSLVDTVKDIPFNQETAPLLTQQILALPHSRFNYGIYKTTAPRHLYYYDRIGLQHYRYEEPTPLAWTILPATATVAGYACQRATTSFGGRQWEAWFTREVSVSDGPYKFYGLPGLIVKVGDTRQHYVFELAKLAKPVAERLLTFPTKAAATTNRAAFRRARADYDADPVSRMAPAAGGGAGVIMQDPDKARQLARERLKRNNNPLELK